MKVRIRWVKQGKIRFTSHRDVARIWERALRKAQVSVVYSQGFSPRPRISFGLALATGQESVAEYLDVDLALSLSEPEAAADYASLLPARLSASLPEGMAAVDARVLPEGSASLQAEVVSCTWEFELGEVDGLELARLEGGLQRLLATKQLPLIRERKGKRREEDVRACIVEAWLTDAEESVRLLVAELGTKPRALRPDEFIGLLEECVTASWLVRRTHQWIMRNGKKQEPLLAESAVLDAPLRQLQTVSAAQQEDCA